MKHWIGLVVVLSMIASSASAEVKLPALFTDHMVVQRDQPLKVWGWADPSESVVVSIGNSKATAVADATGKWHLELPPMPANKSPSSLIIQGTNRIEIKDILVGEVWVCSGQSNMEWSVAASMNPQEEIAAANHPLIRHIKVPLVPSMIPLENFQSSWQVCSPNTAAGFTAVGYYMARELSIKLDIPVGLINSSWGGTRVEPWIPPVGFQRVEALQNIYQSVVGRTPGSAPYAKRLDEHIKSLEDWLVKAKTYKERREVLAPNPSFPAELSPYASNQDPTMLYNGMIHSIVGFPIRGAIWYQGESNHDEGMLYLEKKKALIQGWRELWGQGDFPFYYVQIAPFRYGDKDPTTLAKFWEAQAAVQSAVPKTAMVVINDIATVNDIHPPNKQEVGRRLALLALANDYGMQDVAARSPELVSMELMGKQLKLSFRNTAGGMKTRDGKPPTHFEVIGVGSSGYRPAVAQIQGDSLILSCAEVPEPTAMRFAWDMLAEPNLCGMTGLPVGAFRSGKEPEFLDSIPGSSEYRLVYDLDLGKLSSDIRYDVDNSASAGSFGRVAYLLELSGPQGQEQRVFVSMKAFTKDPKKIGIPTMASKARFQIPVEDLDIYSNVVGLSVGKGIGTGNIEFWPDNYGQKNGVSVSGASDSIYDFGDQLAPPEDGYGSMQVHHGGAKQTVFAINQWKAGNRADIGIGNSEGDTRDWTFTGSAERYSTKRLRVYVK
ncbi:MAG: 9-O-acetylesterase [Planctomycetes bacterium]|nr:9-O-acetylesterase [Planctomycetota bacterium]